MRTSFISTVTPIAGIFCFRMLGLFMLIPVFTIYADELSNSTPITIGVALGIYGLTQGLFQIPFGMLSDKIGRKNVILMGLLLFFIGSVLGAFASSIEMMIAARAIQGTGAIGSTLIALLADLTPNESRTKAMAFLGMSIGCSFALAMVIAPVIAKHFGLAGIFSVTACFAVIGIIILYGFIPNPKREVFHRDSETIPALFKAVLSNGELVKLDLGIFFQHAILTSTFFIIPMLLEHRLSHQWYFYLPILVVSFLMMVPFIIFGEKKHSLKFVLVTAVGLTALAQISMLFFHQSLVAIGLLLFIYFLGFNILEASLPSLVSKVAPIQCKGTAMGVYSCSQFMGIFIGGLLSGSFYHHFGSQGIFFVNSVLALFWFAIALTMKQPKYYSTHIVSLDKQHINIDSLKQELSELAGVEEILFSEVEHALYFKLDKTKYRDDSIEQLLQTR